MNEFESMSLAGIGVFSAILTFLGIGSIMDRVRRKNHAEKMRRLASASESREAARAKRDKREREAACAIIGTDPAVRRATWRGSVEISYGLDADGEPTFSGSDADALAGLSQATRNALADLARDRAKIAGKAEGERILKASAEALSPSATLRAANKRNDDARVADLARKASAHLARCGRPESAKAIGEQGGLVTERDGIASLPRFQQNGVT